MDSERIVYARSTLVTEHDNRVVHMTAGEAWAADDPFVEANPGLFGGPSAPRRTRPAPVQPRVESAAKRGPGASARVTR